MCFYLQVLCRDNTTVLIYDSVAAEAEVQSTICNMTTDQLRILLVTIVEHVNITALRELYIPDDFDPQVILRLGQQLQELQNLPSVQVFTVAQSMDIVCMVK